MKLDIRTIFTNTQSKSMSIKILAILPCQVCKFFEYSLKKDPNQN